MKTKHVMFIMLCFGIAIGINSLVKKHAVQQAPQPEIVAEEATTTPADSILVKQQSVIEIMSVSETEMADISVVVTGQKGSFSFQGMSSSNEMPTVIPEAKIRELVEVQRRLSVSQK